MLPFIIVISLLVLLALLFVVPVLLKPQQLEAENFDQQNVRIARERLQELKREHEAGSLSDADFAQAREELEKTLALDLAVTQATTAVEPGGKPAKILGLSLLIVMPAVAVLIYMQLGSIAAVNGDPAQAAMSQKIPGMNMTMEEAITGLKKKLEQDPNNPQGWYMLARSYMAMGDYAQSVTAFKKTLDLVGDDPELMFHYADALVMSHGGRFAGEPAQVINKALSLVPDHPQGLWMAGMAAAEAGEFKQALTHWYKLEPLLSQDAGSQAEVRAMISNAEQQLSPDVVNKLKKAAGVKAPAPEVATSGANITVQVSLADSMKPRVNPEDTLFVLARALSGPPMPLAVVKLQAKDLPVTVQLNDAMAMMPQMKLSNFKEVRITALVSKSGVAKTSPGDLTGEMSPVAVSTKDPISLVINRVE